MSWLFDLRFSHDARLWLLLAVAVVAIIYAAVQARRGKYALRFSDASLLDTVAPKRPGLRRHIVAVLFLAVSMLMIAAFAGPFEREFPERATIVLTIDTSLSMGAVDVAPTRIEAAKEAAVEFLENAPESIDIGLLSFDEFPVVHATPTSNRDRVIAAVEALELGPFTNTGDAIAASVQAVADTGRAPRGEDGEATAIVVLLSDGEPTVGRTIEDAIATAVELDVAVTTVALGTQVGVVTIEDPDAPGSMLTQPVPVDEATLTEIAEGTGGDFFSIDSIDELSEVYTSLGTALGEDPVDHDRTDWFIGAALVAAALTATLSLLWFQRLP